MRKALISSPESVEDTILVVIAGRVDKRGQSSKWFKAMEKGGLAIEARALTRDQLPRWIEQRLNSQEIVGTAGAVQRLAYYAEGNLMAAAQEISKLALVLGTGATLDEKRLDELTQNPALSSGNSLRHGQQRFVFLTRRRLRHNPTGRAGCHATVANVL